MRLADSDVILINSSGGKDSQVMLDLVATQARAEHVLDRVTVVHCDLGRVEWAGTRDLARAQAEHYGVRFEVVRRPQGDLLDQIRKRGMFPGPSTRYCTADQKTSQALKLMTRLVAEWRAGQGYRPRPCRLLNCLGMRADESSARSKRPGYTPRTKASNGRRTVSEWLPIHTWTAAQVWGRVKASGVPHHPAYDLGMPRLSCVFCIFAPRAALELAGRHNPELLDEYCAVEAEIGHRFTNDLSLASVREAIRTGAPATQATIDDKWCM